jgi:hypothetical protein
MMSLRAYAQSLRNAPYTYWDGEHIPRNDMTPFYAQNGPPPSRSHIDAVGVSCAGYMNLLRRHMGLSVPGVDDPCELYPGGIGAWHTFLRDHLTPFDAAATYEDGTILFRPYTSVQDQGHIGVVFGGQLYHSYAYVWEPFSFEKRVEPGVSITDIWKDGYFTHVAPPSAWLLEPFV